jgi:hypothetical protein
VSSRPGWARNQDVPHTNQLGGGAKYLAFHQREGKNACCGGEPDGGEEGKREGQK